MIVLCIVNCPLQLKGDLTKWLMEINPGIFVGNVNTRIREKIWDRVKENIKFGQVTMVYTSDNEQGFSFKSHNTAWQPADYEGLTLIKKQLDNDKINVPDQTDIKLGFSKAHKRLLLKRSNNYQKRFVIIDLETTGLKPGSDRILEVGALRIEEETVTEELHYLIKQEQPIGKEVSHLTGITDVEIQEIGVPEELACNQLFQFINGYTVIGYNIAFDIRFLEQYALQKNIELPVNRLIDVMDLSKRKVKGLKSYKLVDVAEHFSLDVTGAHRAIKDCYLINGILNELNKIV